MPSRVSSSASDLAADDHRADGAVGAGAGAAGGDQRDHAGDEGEGGHQDRPQPVAVGLADRLGARQALRAQVVGVIDLQDGVLLHDAEQHEDAEHREDVQRLVEHQDREQRERHRQRQREQDRDRVQPALELRREDQVHEDDREQEREHEVRGRAFPCSRERPVKPEE